MRRCFRQCLNLTERGLSQTAARPFAKWHGNVFQRFSNTNTRCELRTTRAQNFKLRHCRVFHVGAATKGEWREFKRRKVFSCVSTRILMVRDRDRTSSGAASEPQARAPLRSNPCGEMMCLKSLTILPLKFLLLNSHRFLLLNSRRQLPCFSLTGQCFQIRCTD
jgi:hypothetical protein